MSGFRRRAKFRSWRILAGASSPLPSGRKPTCPRAARGGGLPLYGRTGVLEADKRQAALRATSSRCSALVSKVMRSRSILWR